MTDSEPTGGAAHGNDHRAPLRRAHEGEVFGAVFLEDLLGTRTRVGTRAHGPASING